MRKNLPVTGQEFPLREGVHIVSRTDTKGVITFVNQDLIEASGFSEAELMGAPQNILRHPDTPAEVFEDLWRTIREGRPWSGVVKNRRKNGDHYWVDSNISPFKEGGRVVGYISVRRKATRPQIVEAERCYRAISAGKTNFRSKGFRAVLRDLSLAKKLSFISLAIGSLSLTALVLFATAQSNALLNKVILGDLGTQNELVIGMIESYAESLEQTTMKLSALFNAQFEGAIRLDEAQTIPVEGVPTPSLAIGGVPVNSDYARVDRFTEISGGVVATVFARTGDDFIRVTTSLKKEDGSRAVGTRLGKAHPAYARLLNGEPFMGRARLFGRDYMTRYEPVKDAHGTVVSVLFIGLDFTEELESLKTRIRSIKVGETGYVIVLDAGKEKGSLVVHPAKEGQNFLAAKDADGREFIREMVEKKSGTIRYPWRNEELGESEARDKISVFGHMPQWDWVVGNGSYVEEFTASGRHLGWMIAIAGLINILVLGAALFFLSRQLVARPLQSLIHHLGEIAQGDYSQQIPSGRYDEIGEVFASLKAMQTRLDFDVTETKRLADENLRIRIALDHVSANVMLADTDRRIIYMNKAVQQMLLGAERDLRADLPQFDARKLLGASIDNFHKNAAHQARMLAALNSTHHATLHIGGRTMDIVLNPVINEQGVRLGSVLEWNDRTAEVAVEIDVADLVRAAAAGDFSRRVALDGKAGFFLQLADGINQVMETTESGINDVGRLLHALSEGDLTQRLNGDYQGLFAHLRDAVNTTAEKLQYIVEQIRDASDAINIASSEIATGNAELSVRTESQAASLEQTGRLMHKFTATAKQNADNARQANHLAQSASAIAVRGGDVVGNMVRTMGDISEASRKIRNIISVIDSIAFQTNLLALNAAVEAARAGEQGRSFAVVASEVRNLAQSSAAAAEEIKRLISNSVDKVNEGYALVENTGTAMQEIVDAVKNVTDIMGEITAASADQSEGILQVNSAVGQMDQVTQQNAALVEQAAAAAESLSDQAKALVTAVSTLRTHGADTQRAMPPSSTVVGIASRRRVA
ncbi:MAG: Cache 3/Cache 2 fusion domain-containing protein [Thiotrichales bacterium]